jgi:hypothetical protein
MHIFTGCRLLFHLVLLTSAAVLAQTPSLNVTPREIKLQMVQGGPLSGNQTVSVAASAA